MPHGSGNLAELGESKPVVWVKIGRTANDLRTTRNDGAETGASRGTTGRSRSTPFNRRQMMKNYKLPLLALAFGTMMTAATAAYAEGDVDTTIQSDTGTSTDLNTNTDLDNTGTDLNTDTTNTQTMDADVEASTTALDTSVLKEIEDDSVMHDGLTVGEIEGSDVYVGDEDIGEIDVVLGDDSGLVKAYILSVSDGVFDMDATKVVVPAEKFTFDAENDRFSTQLTQADLETYETWE